MEYARAKSGDSAAENRNEGGKEGIHARVDEHYGNCRTERKCTLNGKVGDIEDAVGQIYTHCENSPKYALRNAALYCQ